MAAAVDELSDYLIGQDPRNVQDLWSVMYRAGFYRGGPIMMSAIAGGIRPCGTSRAKHWECPFTSCWAARCATRFASIPGLVATALQTLPHKPRLQWRAASRP